MTIGIKDWKRFQHFKDRNPPWIKLYRDLLNDPEWHELDGEAAKALTMLWLLASEHEGMLPSMKKMAFRLRMNEAQLSQILKRLSHWLVQDNIIPISCRYQDDAPETETQVKAEAKKESCAVEDRTEDQFEEFWKAKPSRGKHANPKSTALKAYRSAVKAGADPVAINAAARVWASAESDKAGTEFVPMASTWLNQKRFDDYKPPPDDAEKRAQQATFMRERGFEWRDEKWIKTG